MSVRNRLEKKRTPRNWKNLERHPLSAEYGDLEGRAFDLLVESVKERGIVGNRPIMLFDGVIIDGWQLHRAILKLYTVGDAACHAEKYKPHYENLKLPKGMTAEQYVETLNDHRRHVTQEKAVQRVEERRQRVAAARRDGLSLRAIAEQESISKSQVERDLEEASGVPGGTPEIVTGSDGNTYQVDGHADAAAGEETVGGESGPSVVHPSAPAKGKRKANGPSGKGPRAQKPKVKGRDGKLYPARKGADAEPAAIPERLRPFLESAASYKETARLLRKAHASAKETEQSPAHRKTVEGKEHPRHSTTLLDMALYFENLAPLRPCPSCGDGEHEPSPDSEPCAACENKGFQNADDLAREAALEKAAEGVAT